MKSSYFVILWTIIFIILGLFNHNKIDEFAYKYTDEFTAIESYVNEKNWNKASTSLNDVKNNLEKQKDIWYKLLNHGYFNEIFVSIEILNQSIYLQDQMMSLKEIQKVKMVLNNLIEDECYNLNRIF